MNKLTVALAGAASLIALPVLAQTTQHNTGSNASSTDQNASSFMSGAPSGSAQQVRQKIVQDLKKDGYSNVHVIPDSFLVHATNKQNQPVVMIINPDSVFAVTGVPQQGASNGQSSGGQHLGNNPNTPEGSQGSTTTRQ